ncbi:MAG: BlaI/MecI/CopY family transcriptional regulator [Clostridiales bacterium]|nr:BlaI/MecI/CopY family transcriptional regulator [Clostridiales bacterium]
MKYKLTKTEERLANIIWAKEPISSPELVKICNREFKWKKSTTYTMLRRLEDKRIFINEKSIIKSLIDREGFYAARSQAFVHEVFEGSLPGFLTAFTRNRKLRPKEIEDLQKLIDRHREG